MSWPNDLSTEWRTSDLDAEALVAEACGGEASHQAEAEGREVVRSRPIGDSYDDEPLLTAQEVGERLSVPAKSVYELPIKRVRLGPSRLRWRPVDVRQFINRRVEDPA